MSSSGHGASSSGETGYAASSSSSSSSGGYAATSGQTPSRPPSEEPCVPLAQSPVLAFAADVVVRHAWVYDVPAQCGSAQELCLYDGGWSEIECRALAPGDSVLPLGVEDVAYMELFACGGRLGRVVFDDDDGGCVEGDDDGGGCGPGCWVPPAVFGGVLLCIAALVALAWLLQPAPVAAFVPVPTVPPPPHHHRHHHHHHASPTTMVFDDGSDSLL